MSNITTTNNPANKSGFTLVEVLVATAIVGIAIVPLIHGFVNTWKMTLEDQRVQNADMLAKWKIEDLRKQSYSNITGASTSGNFGADLGMSKYDNYDYTVDVTTVTGAQQSGMGGKKIAHVKVRVEFDSYLYNTTRSVRCTDISSCSEWDAHTTVKEPGA